MAGEQLKSLDHETEDIFSIYIYIHKTAATKGDAESLCLTHSLCI